MFIKSETYLKNWNAFIDWNERCFRVSDIKNESVFHAETEKRHQMGRRRQDGEDFVVAKKNSGDFITQSVIKSENSYKF